MEEDASKLRAAKRISALQALGLNEDLLQKAVKHGVAQSLICTAFDPRSSKGFIKWAKTNAKLREELALVKGKRWKLSDKRNYPRSLNVDRRIAITAVSGDSQTGCEDGLAPKTRWPKGVATQLACKVNAKQISFADILPSEFSKPVDEETLSTWMLVYYVDEEQKEVRIELSLPVGIDNRGRVSAWDKRIILESWSLEPTVKLQDEMSEEYEVPVERRTNQ